MICYRVPVMKLDHTWPYAKEWVRRHGKFENEFRFAQEEDFHGGLGYRSA